MVLETGRRSGRRDGGQGGDGRRGVGRGSRSRSRNGSRSDRHIPRGGRNGSRLRRGSRRNGRRQFERIQRGGGRRLDNRRGRRRYRSRRSRRSRRRLGLPDRRCRGAGNGELLAHDDLVAGQVVGLPEIGRLDAVALRDDRERVAGLYGVAAAAGLDGRVLGGRGGAADRLGDIHRAGKLDDLADIEAVGIDAGIDGRHVLPAQLVAVGDAGEAVAGLHGVGRRERGPRQRQRRSRQRLLHGRADRIPDGRMDGFNRFRLERARQRTQPHIFRLAATVDG